jgi:hypothetical protein
MKEKKKIFGFKFVAVIIIIALIVLITAAGSSLVETNETGEFQIKRAFITGTVTVRDEPGTYGQYFAKIFTYKNVATIGFGREKGEGSADIEAIPIIFNDGSMASNSGLVRIKLPTSGMRKALLEEYSGGYDHFINAGILPVVRNAVKLAANLRSAQAAYTTLALYQQAIQDQLENGTYVTYSAVDTVINATGDRETRQVTKIKYGDNGFPLRNPNRLQELGCEVLECVIDVPDFDKAVMESISKRKDEAMLTELSKQEALRAKQDAITEEQKGLAKVAKARYEKEVELVQAVTKAKESYEVQQYQTKQAAEAKKATILAAEAKKQELLIADGLSDKAKYQIDAEVKKAIGIAEHLSKWKGPEIVMTGGDSKGGGVEKALMISMMQKIATDMNKK